MLMELGLYAELKGELFRLENCFYSSLRSRVLFMRSTSVLKCQVLDWGFVYKVWHFRIGC